jgi:S-adenosylmethionine hydrolase
VGCRTIDWIDGIGCSYSNDTKYPIRDTKDSCWGDETSIDGYRGRSFSCSSGSLSSSNDSSYYGTASSSGAFKLTTNNLAENQSATINVTMSDKYGNIWTDNVTITVQ